MIALFIQGKLILFLIDMRFSILNLLKIFLIIYKIYIDILRNYIWFSVLYFFCYYMQFKTNKIIILI